MRAVHEHAKASGEADRAGGGSANDVDNDDAMWNMDWGAEALQCVGSRTAGPDGPGSSAFVQGCSGAGIPHHQTPMRE